jgi:hypothetical protein
MILIVFVQILFDATVSVHPTSKDYVNLIAKSIFDLQSDGNHFVTIIFISKQSNKYENPEVIHSSNSVYIVDSWVSGTS